MVLPNDRRFRHPETHDQREDLHMARAEELTRRASRFMRSATVYYVSTPNGEVGPFHEKRIAETFAIEQNPEKKR